MPVQNGGDDGDWGSPLDRVVEFLILPGLLWISIILDMFGYHADIEIRNYPRD